MNGLRICATRALGAVQSGLIPRQWENYVGKSAGTANPLISRSYSTDVLQKMLDDAAER